MQLEWKLAKKITVQEGYPRNNMANLWEILNTYHADSFPNLLLHLLQLLSHLPLISQIVSVHSVNKNSSKLLTNHLSENVLDNLLTINIEGPDITQMDFNKVLQKWAAIKERRLFKMVNLTVQSNAIAIVYISHRLQRAFWL